MIPLTLSPGVIAFEHKMPAVPSVSLSYADPNDVGRVTLDGPPDDRVVRLRVTGDRPVQVTVRMSVKHDFDDIVDDFCVDCAQETSR